MRKLVILGIDSWPGKQIHSHNYRVPDQFKDQVRSCRICEQFTKF